MNNLLSIFIIIFSMCGCKDNGPSTFRHWYISYHGHTVSDNEAWGGFIVSSATLPPPSHLISKCVLENANLDANRTSIINIVELANEDFESFTSDSRICK